ncbi:hypothetical protein BU23DRAFT_567808 [Bimuria novae-zelandiae CBS 107.79]|uniref:Uncharacterized protein n=1 Tax=Bimuria novae-zelandiae CBS 107.79 TaxID=1447943 RepID=A0A6A5VG38_9PLEO|nr:hypothetical protein BU23DRAFT_567808 [Bimuria novae-zelandiae CBS 107.79]
MLEEVATGRIVCHDWSVISASNRPPSFRFPPTAGSIPPADLHRSHQNPNALARGTDVTVGSGPPAILRTFIYPVWHISSPSDAANFWPKIGATAENDEINAVALHSEFLFSTLSLLYNVISQFLTGHGFAGFIRWRASGHEGDASRAGAIFYILPLEEVR